MKTSLNLKNNKVNFVDIKEVGQIRDIKKGIARIKGLPGCIYGQLIRFASGIKGLVIGFDERDVMVLVLGDETLVRSGEEVTSQIEPLRIPVGHDFIGRVVNALAEPIDNRGFIKAEDHYPVFREALGVIERLPVDEPMQTGIKIIDTVIPIGRGQRELIIGDRMTGKTTLGIDTILNQKGKDVVCIYCCIGRSQVSLIKIIQLLQERGAMDYTFIVSATGLASPNEQFLAPYTAAALGEFFMFNGQHVLLVFDDLTRHAWAYRQISLLLERAPGREAYPGDIFYIHSQLLERAAKLRNELGGGSMTFLPIAETLQGDFTGYIQTNLVSITDGQIFLSSSLFYEGFKPAIDTGLSISRIGSKAQTPIMRELSRMLRLEYVQYRELLKMTRLRTRQSPEIEAKLKRGNVLNILFTQDRNAPLSLAAQAVLFYAFKLHVLELLSLEQIKEFKQEIFPFLQEHYADLIKKIEEKKELLPEITEKLDKCFTEFLRMKKK